MTGAKAPYIASHPCLDDANHYGQGARKTVYGPRPHVTLLKPQEHGRTRTGPTTTLPKPDVATPA